MKKSKKILFIAFILCFLFVIYTYVCAIDAIPDSIVLFQGEKIDVKTIFGIDLVLESSSEIGTTELEVTLFDSFTIKQISVSVIERTSIVPVGQIAGLKLYTNGVLVVGMTEIEGEDNNKYKPYEDSGLEEGDIIVQIEETTINDTDQLIDIVNESNGEELKIVYTRDEETFETSITPVKVSDTEYKLGLWVRDSAAGIGTITLYDVSTGYFAALGHGITDTDTGELLDIFNGEIVTTEILSVTKGEEGDPR